MKGIRLKMPLQFSNNYCNCLLLLSFVNRNQCIISDSTVEYIPWVTENICQEYGKIWMFFNWNLLLYLKIKSEHHRKVKAWKMTNLESLH